LQARFFKKVHQTSSYVIGVAPVPVASALTSDSDEDQCRLLAAMSTNSPVRRIVGAVKGARPTDAADVG
jgi:hypothetical protein